MQILHLSLNAPQAVLESVVPVVTPTPISRQPSPLCNIALVNTVLLSFGRWESQKVLKWKGHPIIQVGFCGCLQEHGLWIKSRGKHFKGSLGFGSFHGERVTAELCMT